MLSGIVEVAAGGVFENQTNLSKPFDITSALFAKL